MSMLVLIRKIEEMDTDLPPKNESMPVIFLSKSGHKESDEYNHFWRCSIWEGNAISIRKSIKSKQSV